MEDLEVAILELIERIYCAKYCGYIKVREIKDCFSTGCCSTETQSQIIGYELILGLNVKDKPLIIAMSGTQEQFLRFIAKELRSRKLNQTKYFNGYMVDPDSQACETKTKNECCK